MVITRIKIYNRHKMDTIVRSVASPIEGYTFPFKRWHLISIYGGEGRFLHKFNEDALKTLGLQDAIDFDFWDITDINYKQIKESYSTAILFDKQHADVIIDFLKKIQQDPMDSTLVVHCSAGVSRSGAVGTFACHYYKLNYQDFIKENCLIMSNQFILRTLCDAAQISCSEKENGIAPIDGSTIL